MRHDYSVLSYTVDDAEWGTRIGEAYSAGGFDGVYVKIPKGRKIPNLNDLARLPGLRYLEVKGRVVDDTAAFGLSLLRELVLLTRCQVPVPRIDATHIRRLGFDDRPGKESLADLVELQGLSIWLWRDEDFRFLDRAEFLVKLHVEGVGQLGSIRGLDRCRSLVDVEIVAMRVTSLEPLARLSNLKKLWLIGVPDMPDDVTLDLSPIAGLRQLEEFTLTFAGSVQSVRPLAGMAQLRDIRLRGTRILDGDEGPLEGLARSATVVLPGD